MKIVMINHTFQQEQFCKRWRVLAEEHKDWDVTLLAPSEWTWGSGKAVTFGKVEKKNGYEFEHQNFRVKQIHIKNHKARSWTSKDMIEQLESIQPDCVYHIGSHTQESLMQILDYKKNKNPNLKVFAFSMRGPQQNVENIPNLMRHDKSIVKKCLRFFQYYYEKSKVKKLNSLCDAVFCHYPDGMECFKKEGFDKPIFMQTQVGVDTEVFYPDANKRKLIREKYGIADDEYVFGSAVRFNPSKGVPKVLEALPNNGRWKYLLMGSGLPEEIDAIKALIKQRNIESKVILTGFIDWNSMAEHWNAVDCAIHYTQTTPTWIETFSLSLVQAMATGLPVIGSTSGSVPYQIGPDGIIVDENDTQDLANQINWVLNNQDAAKDIGEKLYRRTINSFSTNHLNNLFYRTINNIIIGHYSAKDIDMVNSDII